MTDPAGYGRNHPCLARPRDNGRFTADPSSPPERKRSPKPPKPPKNVDLDDIRRLRQLLRLAVEGLHAMMKPAEPAGMKPAEPAGEDASEKAPESPRPVIRMLRSSEGAVEGINTLTQLTIQLMEKEREIGGLSEAETDGDSQTPEEELDRRIIEELDRIAARKRAAGDAGEACN